MAADPRPVATRRAAGRVLRQLRLAAGLSREEAGARAGIPIRLLKHLESGQTSLGYLEALGLSKAYLLCATCFSRHIRDAVAGAEAAESATEDAHDL